MGLPDSFNNNMNNLHYYQGVIMAEVAATLVLFLLLKMIHYIKWGHNEQFPSDKQDDKPNAEDTSQSRKWDQKSWNVYFPIIFAYHIGGIALIILYVPYIYAAVVAYIHFLCFVVLIILNICVKDAEPGQGSRTKGSRVVWGLMCVLNLMLIVGGLTGVEKVYRS